MMQAWKLVPCPDCRQPVGQRCKALTSDRWTDTHLARFHVPVTNSPDAATEDDSVPK